MGNRSGKFTSFVAFFLGLSVMAATTALSQTISLNDQAAGQVGDKVTFTLSIDYPSSSPGEIRDVTVDINFDHDVLTYDDHTRGSLVTNFTQFRVSNTQDGILKIVGFMSSVDGNGIQPGDSGAIVELHFTVAAMDNTTLTVDTFTDLANFTTRDGAFTFEMPPDNSPPVAADDMVETKKGQAVVIDVLANDEDADGESLTIMAVTQGANGVVTHDGAVVTYTPNAGFTGTDEFMYTVTDGKDADDAKVVITVTPPSRNNPPVATDDEGTTDEDEAIEINVLANDSDPDGDTLSVSDVTEPTNGEAAITANGTAVTYTPDAGFSGEDLFMYTVTDGTGADTATVLIDVEETTVVTPTTDGGGGCALNPGARFDPTLLMVVALFTAVHFLRRFTLRQPLR